MPPPHGEFDSRHELTRPWRLPLSGMLCPEVWICVGVREAKICRDTNPGGAGRLKLLLGTVVESNCSVQTVAQHRITVCSDPQSRSMHFCPSHALAITRRSRRSITITTCNVADARCRQPANYNCRARKCDHDASRHTISECTSSQISVQASIPGFTGVGFNVAFATRKAAAAPRPTSKLRSSRSFGNPSIIKQASL